MSDDDFATLLEQFPPGTFPRVKQLRKGTVVFITSDEVFLDVGYKCEATMPIADARDEAGRIAVSTGEALRVRVVGASQARGVIVVRRATRVDPATKALVETAYRSGSALEGVVIKTTNGGVAVQVGPLRAFCPSSQLELHAGADPSFYVGQRHRFVVLRHSMDTDGDLVLSRRVFLAREAKEQSAATRSRLAPGAVVKGRIGTLKDFGAFMDIGGMDGFIPIDEISHTPIRHPREVLSVGDEVEAEVLNMGQARHGPRLSIKALTEDPFAALIKELRPGRQITVTVVSISSHEIIVLVAGLEGSMRTDDFVLLPSAGAHIAAIITASDPRRGMLRLRPTGEPPTRRRGFATLGEIARQVFRGKR